MKISDSIFIKQIISFIQNYDLLNPLVPSQVANRTLRKQNYSSTTICQKCQQNYSSHRSLLRHDKRKHLQLLGTCSNAETETPSISLTTKLAENFSAKLFCKYCSQEFENTSLLGIHVTSIHNLTPDQVPNSSLAQVPNNSLGAKSSNSFQNLQAPNSSQDQISANTEVEELNSSQHQVPNSSQPDACRSSQRRKLPSSSCLQPVPNNSHDQVPKSSQRRKVPISKEIKTGRKVPNESSYCTICEHQFPSVSNLNRHNIRKHLDLEKFSCPDCERTFKLEYDMKKHRVCSIQQQ